ncbi:hypothetical protein Bca52824_047774 [Brassica carinata]|uniref:Uncharacterized protein n=1 Tax=Brassica carinata TaxID=52824 RepID=A0A8X7RH82_BRACI|nr:hypothetical protein Bca52824_047774 [Brassica carinata]
MLAGNMQSFSEEGSWIKHQLRLKMHEESSSRSKTDEDVMEGAVPAYLLDRANAKIVCSEPGSYGKKDVVIYSNPTDTKGYFHVALTDIIKNLLQCRVKLYASPVETCKNPTNVNKGLTGVPLSMYGYRYHSDKNLKIFSVGPFYFTGPKSAPTTPKY